MSVSDRVIAISKRNRHDELCISIKKELPAFMRVGVSLFELNALEVYKETHKSFAAFVADEFGIEKSHAYRLIEAAKVESNLSPIGDTFLKPTSESQYREIAKAPPEKQAEVVKAVAEICQQEERKPTASDYKKAVEEATSPKVAAVEGELVYEDMDDDDDEIGVEPVKPIPLSNQPEALVPKIKAAAQAITNLKRDVKYLHAQRGGEWIPFQEVELELDQLRYKISKAAFAMNCPKCKSKTDEKCIVCKGVGFVSEARKAFAENNRE